MQGETYPAAAAGQLQTGMVSLTFCVRGRISPTGRGVSGVSGWRGMAPVA